MDAQNELISDTGAVKHAALTLYGYYCARRNKKTGLCFPKLGKTAKDLGIPKSNVSMLKTFLQKVAWIEVYESGVIRPLKGFASDEIRLGIWLKNFLSERISVLIFRICVSHNRTLVLIIRTLFKGNLNQPNQPAQLTSFSADSHEAKSANAPDEKKFDPFEPVGKPAAAAPVSQKKPAPLPPAEKPADHRSRHPAVQMVKRITGRYPPKDQWDKLIREVGDDPDIEFFRASWELWRSFDGKPTNLQGWVFLPNERKKLPEVFARSGGRSNGENGKSPPPDWAMVGKNTEVFETDENGFQIPKPMSEDERFTNLDLLKSVDDNDFDLTEYKRFYVADDWTWLMEELRK